MRRVLLYTLLFLTPVAGFSGTVSKTLYINRGNFQAVDATTFPALAYNADTAFSQKNEVIRLAPGDQLFLTIINNDTASHGFVAEGSGSALTVLPQDTIKDTLSWSSIGVYIYRDQVNSPVNSYLGAAGMIVVDDVYDGEFFWNVREHYMAWNTTLGSGGAVNWSMYKPDYFTVNGNSKPDIANDSTATVTGLVGDTIRIYIANTGISKHSLHFHGYHCRIVYTNGDPNMLNWEKDTFPFNSMEAMILELIPDKPGKYPVHDHNLIAISGGGTYPNGMFLMMDIQ